VRSIYKIALLIATSSLPGVAAAQDGTSQDGAAQAGFGEIIVTAQRREESVQDVPLSVTAVSSGTLEDRHFTDPSQLQFIAPNLQFTSFALSPGATNFSVRGIGTSSFSQLIEPSVATVIDDVVLGRPEMGVMQFSDLERVEILAGPQGMLFGKNASAGLINIVTRRPQLGETTLDTHAEVGVVNAAHKCCSVVLQATGNVALGETAAFRLNGYFTQYKGLVKDVFPNLGSDYGHKEYGFKPKFYWEPSANFSLYLAGDFAHGTGIGTGATTPRAVAPGSPLLPYQIDAGIVASDTNLLRSSNAANNVTFDVGGIQARADYSFDSGVTISNILAWRKYKAFHTFDADYHQIPSIDLASAYFNFRQLTEELRLSSPSDGALEYQAGFFFYAGQTDRRDYAEANLNIGPVPDGYIQWAGLDAYDKLRSRSYALYGQATYHLTDAFSLTAGGRYTWDRLRDVAHAQSVGFVFGFSPDADYTQTNNAKDFSWRVSAQYDFTPDVMGYVTVSTGYKGPGFNQVYSGGSAVGPEQSTAYELGLKSQIGNNVLFNVSLYWEEVKDLQVQGYIPEIPAYLISNAGSLRARGIEAELKVKAASDLQLSVNAAYSDAKFKSFEGAICYPNQTEAQGCVADPENPGSFFTDASGNRLQNAPKLSGTIALDYSPALSGDLDGFLHADLYGRTSVNFSANGNPATTQKGYFLANASAGFGPASEAWKVSVFCRNCFDQRFITFMESNPGGIAGDYGQTFGLTSFRTIGLGVDFKL